MTKEYYFISGLPRSGSTLLAAILRQNPSFYADIVTPVSGLISGTINTITSSESNLNVFEDRRKTILQYIFNGYYAHVDKQVVFDSSRAWTSATNILKELFPYTKIICCVREIKWILDSYERIAKKNCFYTNTLVDEEARSSVETRCQSLMDPTMNGAIIKPWYWLQEGLALNPDMIHLVEYNQLCQRPKETMEAIYKFINKPYFEHDFNNVDYENEPFDRACNMKDLHTVKKKVELVDRKHIIPDYVLEKYSNYDFWKGSKLKYE
jgi:sulfotransferase